MMGVTELRQALKPCLLAQVRLSALSFAVIVAGTYIVSGSVCAWADDPAQDASPRVGTGQGAGVVLVENIGSALNWLDDQLGVAIAASEQAPKAPAEQSLHIFTSSHASDPDVPSQTTTSDNDGNALLRLQGWFDRQLAAGAAASATGRKTTQAEIASVGSEPPKKTLAVTEAPVVEDKQSVPQSLAEQLDKQPGVVLRTKPLLLTKSLSGKTKVKGMPNGLLVRDREQEQKSLPHATTHVAKADTKMEPTTSAPSLDNLVQKASVQ